MRLARTAMVSCLVATALSQVPAAGQEQPGGQASQQVTAAATGTESAAPGTGQESPPTTGEEHTGVKALIKNTGGDFKHLFTDRGPLLWLAAGGAAAAAVHPLDDNVNEHFQGSFSDAFWTPGKVIGYGAVQIGAAVGTWAVGRMIDKRGRTAHIGLDLLRAQVVTQSLTYGLKYTVRRDRPDGSSGFSFPSGHSSTTFASAAVLQRHFGWKAGVPTYAIATYVAASRLHENRHFLSDVVFGGTLGVAAGYVTTRHGRNNFALVPLAVPHGYGVALARIGP